VEKESTFTTQEMFMKGNLSLIKGLERRLEVWIWKIKFKKWRLLLRRMVQLFNSRL
jgi:hypothetical protein